MKVVAVLKDLVDNRTVRARAYELFIAVLGVLATSDALHGSQVGATVQYLAAGALAVARAYVPPKGQ